MNFVGKAGVCFCSIVYPVFLIKRLIFSVNPRSSVFSFGCFVWDELVYGSFQFRFYVIPKLIYRG